MMLHIYDPAAGRADALHPELDYGTPAPVPEYSAEYAALERVSLSIDGQQVAVLAPTTGV